MSEEYLDIHNCPKCPLSHRYKLEVDRAIVMKFMTPMHMDKVEKPRRVKFTRLFTCSETDKDYEATFTLTETSDNRIKGVTVAGEVDDDKQE